MKRKKKNTKGKKVNKSVRKKEDKLMEKIESMKRTCSGQKNMR